MSVPGPALRRALLVSSIALTAAVRVDAAAVAQSATGTGQVVQVVTRDVTISPLQASLSAQPKFPAAGEQVLITLSISNTGAAPVTDLRAGLKIVAGTTFLTSLVGPQPGGPVTINAGGTQLFLWSTSVTGLGTIDLSASVTGSLAGQKGLVGATASLALAVTKLVQLSALLSPNPVHVSGGRWFTMVMTVSNTGRVTVSGVTPDLSIAAGSPLVTPQSGPEPSEPVLLRPGESERFAFTYSANGSGIVTFTGTVTGVAALKQPGWFTRARASAQTLFEKTSTTGSRLVAKAKAMLSSPVSALEPVVLLTSFESPGSTRWITDGYVEVSQSDKHVTPGGRYSLRASFLVASDFTVTSTGAWHPALRLRSPARGSATELSPHDWSGFSAFKIDCFSEVAQPINLTITFTDRRGYQFAKMHQVPAASATTIEISLAGLQKAQLDLTHLAELKLDVDATDLTVRPVLYLDHLRLLRPPSTTTLLSFTVTATGQTAPPSTP